MGVTARGVTDATAMDAMTATVTAATATVVTWIVAIATAVVVLSSDNLFIYLYMADVTHHLAYYPIYH